MLMEMMSGRRLDDIVISRSGNVDDSGSFEVV